MVTLFYRRQSTMSTFLLQLILRNLLYVISKSESDPLFQPVVLRKGRRRQLRVSPVHGQGIHNYLKIVASTSLNISDADASFSPQVASIDDLPSLACDVCHIGCDVGILHVKISRAGSLDHAVQVNLFSVYQNHAVFFFLQCILLSSLPLQCLFRPASV
jgi:hypothetical protein